MSFGRHLFCILMLSLAAIAPAAALEVTRSTFLGGSGVDDLKDIAVGVDGSVYVVGTTQSSDFMGTGAAADGSDIFVARISEESELLYAVLVGGSDTDEGLAIDVDPQGNAYVLAYTFSAGLPTPNGSQATLNGTVDAYIFKLDGAGTLVYGTYHGGSETDGEFEGGIAWRRDGEVYVAGRSDSTDDMLLANAYESTCDAPPCAFVAGFDTNASGAASLFYSTFVGGSGGEAAFDVGLDSSGRVYFFGFTESATDLVIPGQGYQDQIGSINDRDHFLMALDPALTGAQQLVYSTFIGGSGDEEEVGKIKVNEDGVVWVTGNTSSADFLNPQANLPPMSHLDAYVLRVDTRVSGAASLEWAQFIGAGRSETGFDVEVDANGNVLVGIQSNSIGLNYIAPLPEFADLGQPAELNGMTTLATLTLDGQLVSRLTPLVRSSTFLPVRLKLSGSTLHLASTATDRNVFVGNVITSSTPPPLDPATNRDAYVARFQIQPETGLRLVTEASLDRVPTDETFFIRYGVDNTGTTSFTNVELTAEFPAQASVVSVPPICDFPTPGNSFTCQLPDLEPGADFAVYLAASAAVAARLDFAAAVSADETDIDTGDNADQATVDVGNGVAPLATLTRSDWDVIAPKFDIAAFALNSRWGMGISSQGAEDAVINLLKLDGSINLYRPRVDNAGLIAFGWLDSGQWTPVIDDGLDLQDASNPAHRVYATVNANGVLELISAPPFSAGVSVAQTRIDALADAPLTLTVDTTAGTAQVLSGSSVVLSADPFVVGGADSNSLGDDYAVSAAYGPDFIGGALLSNAEQVADRIMRTGFDD